jgi:hypothetical protein
LDSTAKSLTRDVGRARFRGVASAMRQARFVPQRAAKVRG